MIGCNYLREHAPCSFLHFLAASVTNKTTSTVLLFSFCKCQKAKGAHHVRIDSEGGGWQVNECELELGSTTQHHTACAHRHAEAVGRPRRPSCEGIWMRPPLVLAVVALDSLLH